MDVTDRRQQVARTRRLDKVPVRARRQGAEKIVGVLVNRQHHDLQLRQTFRQLPYTLDAVHAGQINVHHRHLRMQGRRLRQRLLARAERADTGTLGIAVDNLHEAGTQPVVVFHYDHIDGHHTLPATHPDIRLSQ